MPEQADAKARHILFEMNVKIAIPQDYASVSVGQFMDLQAVWDKSPDPRWRAVQGVRILCKVEPGIAEKLTIATLDEVYTHLSWLMNNEHEEMELQPMIEVGNRRYGFIPDLHSLSLGEFVDLELCAKQGFATDLAKAMSVLYRRVTDWQAEHYLIEAYDPHERKVKAMRDLPMDAALGAMVFFSRIANRLSVDMVNYSKTKEEGRP